MTIPTGSVNIANDTYMITLLVMCMYFLSAVRLLFSISCMWSERKNSVGIYETFWLVYECLLLVMVLCSLFVLFARWQFMEIAEKLLIKYAEKRIATIVLNVVLVHNHVNILATVAFALTVFRLYRSEMNMTFMVDFEFAIHHSVFQIVVIFGYVFAITHCSIRGTMNTYQYINALLMGRHGPFHMYFLESFLCYIMHVIIILALFRLFVKNYTISKMYLRKLTSV